MLRVCGIKKEKEREREQKNGIEHICEVLLFFFISSPNNSPSSCNLTQHKASAQLLQDVNMQDSYLPVQSDEHAVSSFSVKLRCLYPILCVCLHPRQICSLTQAQKGSLKSPQSISEGRPGFYFCRVKGKKIKRITFNGPICSTSPLPFAAFM